MVETADDALIRGRDPQDHVLVIKEGTPGSETIGKIPIADFAQPIGLITAAPATDQADWNPAGFGSGVGTIKLQPTTNCFLTGLLAGATDQEIRLVNDSDFVVCVEGESGASTAANRFAKHNRTLWLLPHETMTFRYSATLARWKLVEASKQIGEVNYKLSLLIPVNGGVPGGFGRQATALTATLGTGNSAANPTNEFQEEPFFSVSNGTANGTSSFRTVSGGIRRGPNAGRQGFFHTARVLFNTLGVTGALRAGLTSSTGVITTLNAALTQCLLLGADGTMTTLRIFSGSATAGTPVDLGANFPVPSATAAYEYCFYAPSGSSFVRWMVRRLDTRFVAQGTLTANIPTDTTLLLQRLEAMVGATAANNSAHANFLIMQGL